MHKFLPIGLLVNLFSCTIVQAGTDQGSSPQRMKEPLLHVLSQEMQVIDSAYQHQTFNASISTIDFVPILPPVEVNNYISVVAGLLPSGQSDFVIVLEWPDGNRYDIAFQQWKGRGKERSFQTIWKAQLDRPFSVWPAALLARPWDLTFLPSYFQPSVQSVAYRFLYSPGHVHREDELQIEPTDVLNNHAKESRYFVPT